jgi:hypothetical protein
MAKAIFHSVRGEKKTSALIGVKPNLLVRSWTYVYCALEGVPEDSRVQDKVFDIPDGYHLKDMYNQDGEPITSNDGTQLRELAY